DPLVTGVQTCALPIFHGTWKPKIAMATGLWMRNGSEIRGRQTPAYRRSASSVGRPVRRIAVATESMSYGTRRTPKVRLDRSRRRSEERRVGQEGEHSW